MLPKFYFISVIFILVEAQNGPVIDTIYGSLQGSVKTNRNDLEYEEYLGVPYAAPPVGEKRWMKPEVPVPWEGVRNATEFGSRCVQITENYTTTSEDCLFLNVYVPGRERLGDNLAVMVWVHGGGYFFGSSNNYPAYDIGLMGDVITVTINYRLGPIGFLSTEDEAAPGNYGLWDVRAALQWVQDCIAAFGGDAGRVTVFGQSAGSAITSHLMISPQAEGLLHRGISVSGQSSGPFGVALKGKVRSSTELLANFVGCRRINDSYELIDCLREVPARELDFWGFVLVVTRMQQMPNFIPVIDGEFVPQRPEDSWAEGAAIDKDFMTGRLQHDGHGFVSANLGGYPDDLINFAVNETLLDFWLSFQLGHYPDTEAGVVVVDERYPLMDDDSEDVRNREATQQCTDFWFSTFCHTEASSHARTTNGTKGSYMFNFNYRQSFLQYPHEWVNGSHADELYSTFGYDLKPEFRLEDLGADFNEQDYLVSDTVMTYFTNFANTGNPNEGIEVPVEWPGFNYESNSYLEISDNPAVLNETSEMRETYHFWHDEFPQIVIPEYNETIAFEIDEDDEFILLEQDVLELAEAARQYLYTFVAETEGDRDQIDNNIDEALLKYYERQEDTYYN